MKSRQEIEAEYERLRDLSLTDAANGMELEISAAMGTLIWALSLDGKSPMDLIGEAGKARSISVQRYCGVTLRSSDHLHKSSIQIQCRPDWFRMSVTSDEVLRFILPLRIKPVEYDTIEVSGGDGIAGGTIKLHPAIKAPAGEFWEYCVAKFGIGLELSPLNHGQRSLQITQRECSLETCVLETSDGSMSIWHSEAIDIALSLIPSRTPAPQSRATESSPDQASA